MCGIAGFVDFEKKSNIAILRSMVETLNHRGPDDQGAEIFDAQKARIGFGQARLAIIDLSFGGHQPMHYNHYTIVYNGEIYNYAEIREELRTLGHIFQTSSDTEVILHAFEEWGLKCVDRFIGMFVFTIFDKKTDELFIFRDRAGVKPLYYYYHNNVFLFASELKAFHKHPKFDKEIDPKALNAYFDFGYIPSPNSIFKNCHKLEPGKFLIFSTSKREVVVSTYWDLFDHCVKPPLKMDYTEAKEELHHILKSAFNYRMVADVPVGVFLSGGYDSSAVAAILQSTNSQKLKTFTIGFEDGVDEAPYAKQVAKYLDTDHHEYYCSTQEAKEIIPDLPYYYDEPFADSSAIPTILVSRMARKEVKVALSADGGDETFGGYNHYTLTIDTARKLKKVPNFMTPVINSCLQYLPQVASLISDKKVNNLNSVYEYFRHESPENVSKLYLSLISLPQHQRSKFGKKKFKRYLNTFDKYSNSFTNPGDFILMADYKEYLQNDILTKVDRATMSVSLEGREPLLDHRIIEFASRLPLSMKNNGIESKIILKDIVHDYLPKEMMERPKQGFSLPIFSWLQSDLSYLIEEHLNQKDIRYTGFFDEKFVLQQVNSFKSGKLHHTTFIWKLLMFLMWYKRWM